MKELAILKHDPLGPTHEACVSMTLYPLVSVIVPAYNVEAYIDCCIDSIVHQTYGNFELILVDDGSTDATGRLCDAWARRDGRVRVYHVQNAGVGAARNRGMSHAQGSFIAFVDSDDYLKPRYLERLVTTAIDNDADLAECATYYVDPDNKLLTSLLVTHASRGGVYSGREYALNWNVNTVWGKLIKTNLCRQSLFDESLDLGEDAIFINQILPKCERVALCDTQRLYFYRQRADGLSGDFYKMDFELHKKRVDLFLRVYRYFISLGDEELARAFFLRSFRNLSTEFLHEKGTVHDKLKSEGLVLSITREAFRTEGISMLPAVLKCINETALKHLTSGSRRWLFMHSGHYRKRHLDQIIAPYRQQVSLSPNNAWH